jgi:hypothetical protein
VHEGPADRAEDHGVDGQHPSTGLVGTAMPEGDLSAPGDGDSWDGLAAWQPMDLRLYIVSNWATLGPKLTNRFHDYGGDDDSFFLNNSSELLETAMASLTNPSANADFLWINNGGHGASPYTTPPLLTRMYNSMIAEKP